LTVDSPRNSVSAICWLERPRDESQHVEFTVGERVETRRRLGAGVGATQILLDQASGYRWCEQGVSGGHHPNRLGETASSSDPVHWVTSTSLGC